VNESSIPHGHAKIGVAFIHPGGLQRATEDSA
jgi:hypothetical protein